jgi:Fe-Mn family superoxide dismutase
MNKYKETQFNISELSGISKKNIEEHLKLYAGYVKNTNLIIEKITDLQSDSEKNAYTIGELQRRLGFEFDGMRNHEYYFKSLEGGPVAIADGMLKNAIEEQFGSFEKWLSVFSALALTRGVGWAMLYYDHHTGQLIHAWVEEQHLGHLIGLQPILALDMWEHAYVYDYATSEKKNYVEAFFKNINWSVIENNFTEAKKLG